MVKYFLKLASDKASAAREGPEQAVLQEVEDGNHVTAPENLLLSSVCGECVKKRCDDAPPDPWVKFLWDSYWNMLELLKNNNTVQKVYADVAKDALRFCLEYQRKREFRKLCEILKNHLLQAKRYQTQPHSLRFDNTDTIQYLVDVRFEQVACSITIHLCPETFKAIEDIHYLLELNGKAPCAGLLERYYSCQAKVYWMANSRLFHAAAWHMLFLLCKEQETITPEDLQKIASQAVLATLCVPIEPIPSVIDQYLGGGQTWQVKAHRLAGLLRMNTLPTRASLLRDLCRHDILQYATPELQHLHSCLEVEFKPLTLSNMCPILEKLEENMAMKQYVKPMKEVVLVRLIKQVREWWMRGRRREEGGMEEGRRREGR